MAKRIRPLYDLDLKKAIAKPKPYKLSDGGGLFLWVTPVGSRLWRLKYTFMGKEKLLSIGAYPAVTLVSARKICEEAKELLSVGHDPGEIKKTLKAEKAERTADTFEV